MTAINVTARVTSRKSLALAGYVSAFYVHDGVAEQGYKTLTMLETRHWDSCPIYLLHLVCPEPKPDPTLIPACLAHPCSLLQAQGGLRTPSLH